MKAKLNLTQYAHLKSFIQRQLVCLFLGLKASKHDRALGLRKFQATEVPYYMKF